MSTSVTTGPATVFSDTRAVLAESIVWDPSAQLLRWTDITLGTLVTAQSDGTVVSTVPLPPPLASFQPRASGGFVAALGDTVVVTDEHGVVERELTRVEHATAGLRFNEGKCDPFGRFLVGSMNLTTGEPDGALYSVEADGTTRLLRGGFGVTNGFEWSDDGRTVYVTDTPVKTVYRASYGEDGRLGPLEPFLVNYDSDGLALDTDGRFWNGVSGSGTVLCWSPEGAVEDHLAVPVPNVTSVAFGGPDLSTLFVGTAREGLDEDQLERAPLSGAIFRFDGLATGRPVGVYGARAAAPRPTSGTTGQED